MPLPVKRRLTVGPLREPMTMMLPMLLIVRVLLMIRRTMGRFRMGRSLPGMVPAVGRKCALRLVVGTIVPMTVLPACELLLRYR